MSGTIATLTILLVLGFVGYACYVGGYRDGYHDRHIGYRKRRYRMRGSKYDL